MENEELKTKVYPTLEQILAMREKQDESLEKILSGLLSQVEFLMQRVRILELGQAMLIKNLKG